MRSRLKQGLVPVLPVAALLSLVCGPSPSAASAEYQARMARAQRARQHPSKTSQPKHAGDDASSLASFVAPASAKPAETNAAGSKLVAAQPAQVRVVSHVLLGVASTAVRQLPRPLHHPVFQANAPPSR